MKPLPVEDRIYGSGNELEIPDLLPDMQPRSGLLLPFAGWGIDGRAKRNVGTYHFYVDDYRFKAIWRDPGRVLAGGCRELVEPTCRCSTPRRLLTACNDCT